MINLPEELSQEEKARVEALKWWHRIKLDEAGYTTPGFCDHGTGEDVNTRFALPLDLEGKRVLDVGAYDGLFAFEAEKRGGIVAAIDVYQYCAGQEATTWEEANAPFKLAKELLQSSIMFLPGALEMLAPTPTADVVLYYGVLYHIENPLGAIRRLAAITTEVCIIETTYAKGQEKPVLEYRPNFANDKTNEFYPSLSWLDLSMREAGFKNVELHWKDDYRCTVKGYK